MEIDYIHFYVESAEALRDWLLEKMGLQCLAVGVASPGEHYSSTHTATYSVGNSYFTFWISAPLDGSSPVAAHLREHPAGVKDIAFRVPCLDLVRQRIQEFNGVILADGENWLRVAGWGSIEHTIYQGVGKHSDRSNIKGDSNHRDLLTGIDHVVLNVHTNDLEAAVKWYRDLFDFQVQQDFQIQTAKSGLRSKALTSGPIRFNINEPIENSSQIQEFLDANGGPGIQHIALHSNDIIQAVDEMQQRDLAFLPVAGSYYGLRSNPTLTDAEWLAIEQLQILVDWSPQSPAAILMQTFTKPIFPELTFFFEIIERRNQASGFGAGNFQALFEAIEASAMV
jgi:4-hydroxyphenylpyruvate dioxygenase